MSKVGKFFSTILNILLLWTPAIGIVAFWFNDAYGHQKDATLYVVGGCLAIIFGFIFCLNIYWYLRYCTYFEHKVRCLLFVICNALLIYLSIVYLFHGPGLGDIAFMPLLFIVMFISLYFSWRYVMEEPIVQMFYRKHTNDVVPEQALTPKYVFYITLKRIFYALSIEMIFVVVGITVTRVFGKHNFLFDVYLALMFIIPLLIRFCSKKEDWKAVSACLLLFHLSWFIIFF